MKLIPLTQGKFAMVDDHDFEELNQYRWYAGARHFTWYAIRTTSRNGGQSRKELMHQVLTGFDRTDHIDGDGLNNQRANLRDGRWNNWNARARQGCVSRYKGVGWRDLPSSSWYARIKVDGKVRYLGGFRTEEEAALAYDAAARELFGPYAALNFARPGERSALTGELVAA